MNTKRKPRLLVVDDEEDNLKVVQSRLTRRGYEVICASSGPEALEMLDKTSPDLVLLDYMMPEMDGLETLARIKESVNNEFLPIIMLTAKDDKESMILGFETGADDYVHKPFDVDELNARIQAMLRIRSLKLALSNSEREIKRLTDELTGQFQYKNIVGSSEVMRDVFERIKGAATITSPVIITGESGTGKELIARGIHFSSAKAAKPFVPVNCAALPGELIESELFGHKKGAFTGAVGDYKGLFKRAHEGTIFLDEIGELPKEAQAKLLRVLQEGAVRPVGGTEEIKVNTRIIAATNIDLDEAVEDGRFREDLYYRISVLTIEAPPLRHRKSDIGLLVKHFIDKLNKDFNRSIKGVDDSAMKALTDYDWPGNVREMINVIESCYVYPDLEWISEKHLRLRKNLKKKTAIHDDRGDPGEFLELEEMEKAHIEKAMALADNNKAKAARLLGIHRSRLYKKLESYDIGL